MRSTCLATAARHCFVFFFLKLLSPDSQQEPFFIGIFFLGVNCNRPFETSVSLKNKGLFLASTECPLQFGGTTYLGLSGIQTNKGSGSKCVPAITVVKPGTHRESLTGLESIHPGDTPATELRVHKASLWPHLTSEGRLVGAGLG